MKPISKFCQAVQDILNFSAPKKGLFREDLKGTYISRMATWGVFLMIFFSNFIGIKFVNKGLNKVRRKSKNDIKSDNIKNNIEFKT